MQGMRFRFVPGLLGIFGVGLCLGCGGGGIEFNGEAKVFGRSQRSSPIEHFPLPVEYFDATEQEWSLDREVITDGRDTATPPGSPYPDWSEPMTDAMEDAMDPTVFEPRDNVDLWFTQGTLDREPAPTGNTDETEYLLSTRVRGAAMSYCSQWLMQTVYGKPREDGPFQYDSQTYEPIAIALVAHSSGIPAAGTWDIDVATTSLPNPVDSRIGLFGIASDDNVVFTQNLNALYAPVNTRMPGTANDIEWAHSSTTPEPLLFGKYMEVAGENLFIESNFALLTNAPTSSYFTPSGRSSIAGGIYVDRLNQSFTITYPNATLTGDYVTGYYAGAIQGHIIGVGVGVPQVAFLPPGRVNGEEDIMNVNVETDQTYFGYGNRRFQYTSEALLIMQDVHHYPHEPEADGSFPRQDAFILAADPENTAGELHEDCIFMRETTPGPNRSK